MTRDDQEPIYGPTGDVLWSPFQKGTHITMAMPPHTHSGLQSCVQPCPGYPTPPEPVSDDWLEAVEQRLAAALGPGRQTDGSPYFSGPIAAIHEFDAHARRDVIDLLAEIERLTIRASAAEDRAARLDYEIGALTSTQAAWVDKNERLERQLASASPTDWLAAAAHISTCSDADCACDAVTSAMIVRAERKVKKYLGR